MVNPASGATGGMEAQQALARELIEERQQQGTERQATPEQTQERPQLSREELDAQAFERNLMLNDAVKERNDSERQAKLSPEPQIIEQPQSQQADPQQQRVDDELAKAAAEITKEREQSPQQGQQREQLEQGF